MSSKKSKGKDKGKGKGNSEASVTESLEASTSGQAFEETEGGGEADGNVDSSSSEGAVNEGGEGEGGGAGVVETPALVRKHVPRAPLPERMVDKAKRAAALVEDVSKVVAIRGAPTALVDASKILLAQVTDWARSVLDLKDSGWVPTDPSVTMPINEGDPIKIVDDEKGIYNYIPGVLEGTAQLVAGPSIIDGKKQVKILVKDSANGGVYGYIPKRFLDHQA